MSVNVGGSSTPRPEMKVMGPMYFAVPLATVPLAVSGCGSSSASGAVAASSSGSTSPLSTPNVGQLAGLFSYHELKLAIKDAPHSPKLGKLVAPITALADKIKSIGSGRTLGRCHRRTGTSRASLAWRAQRGSRFRIRSRPRHTLQPAAQASERRDYSKREEATDYG